MDLINYYLEGNREHLVDVPEFQGRHPGDAIKRAKEILAQNARSPNDEIRIYSISAKRKKLLGQVLFRGVRTENQTIDWLPAGAPHFREHSGEIRARGINAAARRGITHKSRK